MNQLDDYSEEVLRSLVDLAGGLNVGSKGFIATSKDIPQHHFNVYRKIIEEVNRRGEYEYEINIKEESNKYIEIKRLK